MSSWRPLDPGGADCAQFRSLLEQKLSAGPGSPALSELGWHEHLLGCAGCRTLLEEEEALEMLLASLPEPRLPADLARRLVARLRDLGAGGAAPSEVGGEPSEAGAEQSKADTELERLLERAGEVHVPDGLAGRVLAGLGRSVQARSAAEVDALLALDREPDPPEGLSERVLAGLQAELARSAGSLRPTRRVGWPSDALRRVAAVLVATVVLAFLWKSTLRPRSEPLTPGDSGVATRERTQDPGQEPDDDMLAVLDVLENWELLAGDVDLDLDLATFDGIDPADEVVLDLLPASGSDEVREDRPATEDSNG